MQQQQPKYQVAILGPDQTLNFKIASNLGFPEKSGTKGETVLIENCEFTIMEDQQRDFSAHYSKMSPYEYAILTLPNPDMCKQDLSIDKTMMPHNYFYIQMLQHLQVKQILVYIETELGKSKNDILQLEKWIAEEMDRIFKGIKLDNDGQPEQDKRVQNPLKFDVPTVRVVSKVTLQTVNEFFKPIDRDLKRELYVLTLFTKGKVIHLKVLSGFFYIGQTLYFQGNKVEVEKIEYFDKEVIYAEEGQMVKITVKSIDKINGIGHGHNQLRKIVTDMELNVVLGQIERKQQPITVRLKLNGVRLWIYNQKLQIKQVEAIGELFDGQGKVINFSQNQNHYAYRIKMKNTEKSILHYPYFNGVILLESAKDIFISCFCRLQSVVTEDKMVPENLKSLLILPQFEKEPTPKMMYANKDGRYMCRICREQTIRSVLIECGHLRYCEDCVQSCIENKACFYCEKEVTKLKALDIKFVKQSLYDKCEVITDPTAYFKANQDKTELPPYFQILNQLVHEEPSFKDCLCDQCNKELFTHYQICVNADFHLNRLCKKCSVKVCGTCQQEVKAKQQIIYRFPDDPQ